MKRQKVLVRYESDLMNGVMFLKFRKQIVEDDGSITDDGFHRETITSEAYDELKKLQFADIIPIANAEALNRLATVLKAHKEEKEQLKVEVSTKDAEIIALKKAKK